jgi:hypothetical protein
MIKDILIFSVSVMGTIFIGSVIFILVADKVAKYLNNLKK